MPHETVVLCGHMVLQSTSTKSLPLLTVCNRGLQCCSLFFLPWWYFLRLFTSPYVFLCINKDRSVSLQRAQAARLVCNAFAARTISPR